MNAGSENAPAADTRGESPAAWLDLYESEINQRREALARRESTWSWLRLAIFIVAVGVWPFLYLRPVLAGVLTIIAVVAFVIAVRRHQALREQREHVDRILQVIGETRRRLGGRVELIRDWQRPDRDDDDVSDLTSVLEHGPCWALTGQERDDLDLFAPPVGVFGLLNRTSTTIGARRLRDCMDNLMLSPEHIERRQQSVRWLAQHPAERLELLAELARLRIENRRLARLTRALREAHPLDLPLPAPALRAWSVFTGAGIVAAIVGVISGQFIFGWPLSLLILINMSLYGRLAGRLRHALDPWQDTEWAARGYLAVARCGVHVLPRDGELGVLRECFLAAGQHAALPRLMSRLRWTESGGLMGFLLNTLMLIDLHVARSLTRCVVAHQREMISGLAALADLEALLSLACFAWEQPVAAFPRFAPDARIEITGGRHPLIDPQRVVPNDVRLDGRTRVWVLTGSNMAGKSTLLRMTGTNVVLAQLGTAVAADAMNWSPLRLITDLRARDNLAASESYFLAEVRHLRRMVVPPDGDEPILGLIDEPFRGTNSRDQTAASLAVLQHLLESPHMFMVATHDRHLTELADGELARNYHFRENLGEHGMVFDYRLHAGPATTRNALLVLEREGYPPTLLERAHGWAGDASEDLAPSDGRIDR